MATTVDIESLLSSSPSPAKAPEPEAKPTDPAPEARPVRLVRLLSGGPPLTVTGRDEKGLVVVAWFSGDELKTARIADALLVPVELP